MRLVRAEVGQRDIKDREQLDLHSLVAEVVDFNLPELDVILRTDPYGGPGFLVGPDCGKANPIGMVGAHGPPGVVRVGRRADRRLRGVAVR